MEYMYDKWLTSTPEDKGHDWSCSCGKCHEHHILIDGYKDITFPCCTDEVDFLMTIGKWCPAKPGTHGGNSMFEGKCERCSRGE